MNLLYKQKISKDPRELKHSVEQMDYMAISQGNREIRFKEQIEGLTLETWEKHSLKMEKK